jgi:predicted metal-binding membrane protein
LSVDAALRAALRRERLIALAALLFVAALAWGWTLHLAAQMAGMNAPAMTGITMSHLQMLSPAMTPWSMPLGLYLFAMWAVMMVGMMTPSAAPMVLLYLGVARHAAGSGHRFAGAAWLFAGYLLAWCLFALVATLAQWGLESTAMMTAGMQAANPTLGAVVLIAAGLYQWLPVKNACLTQCRAPLSFIQQHGGFQPSAAGSLRLGFAHGLYCVGCCWLLMLVLFVVGVMNLLWIAALTLFVLAEKLVPRPLWLARGAGMAAMAAGLAMLLA